MCEFYTCQHSGANLVDANYIFLLGDLDGEHVEMQKSCRHLEYNLKDFEKILAEEDTLTKEQKGKLKVFKIL